MCHAVCSISAFEWSAWLVLVRLNGLHALAGQTKATTVGREV